VTQRIDPNLHVGVAGAASGDHLLEPYPTDAATALSPLKGSKLSPAMM
jgi:hypothetical protein